ALVPSVYSGLPARAYGGRDPVEHDRSLVIIVADEWLHCTITFSMEPHQVRADKGDIALTERQPSAADSAGRRQTSCGLRRVQPFAISDSKAACSLCEARVACGPVRGMPWWISLSPVMRSATS